MDHVHWLAAVAVVVPTLMALPLSVHLWATFSEDYAQWFSEVPMGLRATGRSRPLRHAVLDVRPFTSAEDWAQSLESRGCRRTMQRGGQIDKAWRTHGVGVRAVAPRHLGWAHFRVIVAHERRSYSLVRAVLAAVLRFFVARSMVGAVDEYRSGGGAGELLGWAQVVVKGATLRAMWFYQAHGGLFIWHGGVRHAVERAAATPGVHHVDLGPSKTAQVAGAKERFGFADVEHWRDVCGYDGAFAAPAPLRP